MRHRSFVPQRLSYEIALNVQMRYRNEVAFVFLGDFHIKSHSCRNAMSKLDRSCVTLRLSDKSRIHVPMRHRIEVANGSHCDVTWRSICDLCAMSQPGRIHVPLRHSFCDVAATFISYWVAAFSRTRLSNNRSVMPLDVRGRTRATLTGSACLLLGRKVRVIR